MKDDNPNFETMFSNSKIGFDNTIERYAEDPLSNLKLHGYNNNEVGGVASPSAIVLLTNHVDSEDKIKVKIDKVDGYWRFSIEENLDPNSSYKWEYANFNQYHQQPSFRWGLDYGDLSTKIDDLSELRFYMPDGKLYRGYDIKLGMNFRRRGILLSK